MIALAPHEFALAKPLFHELAEMHLFVTAVFNHDLPGRIYVDDVDSPRSGFMSTKEMQFLAGDPDNMAFNTALKQVLRSTICIGDAPEVTLEEIDLTFVGDRWLEQLPFLFGDWRWPPIPDRAAHYRLTSFQGKWRESVPDGYTILPLDKQHIAHHPEDLSQFEVKQFADFGPADFGFCALWNGRIVCMCSSDVVSGQACEIGIETHPEHRRKGLATVTTAATVEYALSAGLSDIRWICEVENIGSVKTAVNVGFTEQFQTTGYFFILDEAEHRRQTSQ